MLQGTKTKAVIGELEGKVENKTKIEVIKEEFARITEERKEHMEEKEQLAKVSDFVYTCGGYIENVHVFNIRNK